MNREVIFSTNGLRHELEHAEFDSVAARGLLEDVIDPMFEDFRCDGILDVYAEKNDGDRNKAARAWMDENYDALYAAIYAVNLMVSRVSDTLQGMPQVQPVKEA